MIANFPWALSKTEIFICYRRRIMEGCGVGACWEFVLAMVLEGGGWGRVDGVEGVQEGVGG